MSKSENMKYTCKLEASAHSMQQKRDSGLESSARHTPPMVICYILGKTSHRSCRWRPCNLRMFITRCTQSAGL